MNKKILLLAAGIPVLMLFLSLIAFVVNTRIAEGKPVIEEISPQIVKRGDMLTISGENFGNRKESSRIFLSSLDLLSRHIESWSDKEIVISLPEKANSGLLVIQTERGKSKPVVFVLEVNIPSIGAGAYIPGYPFIENIDPSSARAGDIMTITGENFGHVKKNGTILFSSFLSRETDSLDGGTEYIDYITVDDSMIINWADKSIRFYLPDFVVSGNVYVKTEIGHSNAAYFDQMLATSTIELKDKRTYMIGQTSSITAGFSDPSGKINYWIVSPDQSLSQRNIVNLSDRRHKSLSLYPGETLYTIGSDNMVEDSFEIRHNTILDVYSTTFTVDPDELPARYDSTAPLFLKYTASTDLITASSSSVSSAARSLTRRISTPYKKGRAIYDYVINRLSLDPEALEESPEAVIAERSGNSKAYSLLFTALCRSAGLPARPVTGLLVDEKGEGSVHWWAEFYLQGFGWFPVDPALADSDPDAEEQEKAIENNWGNIDNQHIAFSRGEVDIPLFFPDGLTGIDIDHAFVTHNREMNGAIINLHLDWSDVRITAIY